MCECFIRFYYYPLIFAGCLWFGLWLVYCYTIHPPTIVWRCTLSFIQRNWRLCTTFHRCQFTVVCNHIYIVYFHYTRIVNYFMQFEGESNSITLLCIQMHAHIHTFTHIHNTTQHHSRRNTLIYLVIVSLNFLCVCVCIVLHPLCAMCVDSMTVRHTIICLNFRYSAHFVVQLFRFS